MRVKREYSERERTELTCPECESKQILFRQTAAMPYWCRRCGWMGKKVSKKRVKK